MFPIDSLKIHYCSEDKATAEFCGAIQQSDEMLQDDNNAYLQYPVKLYDKRHEARWYYKSMQPEEVLREYDDQSECYLFDCLVIGICVTTNANLVGDVEPWWMVYVADYTVEK